MKLLNDFPCPLNILKKIPHTSKNTYKNLAVDDVAKGLLFTPLYSYFVTKYLKVKNCHRWWIQGSITTYKLELQAQKLRLFPKQQRRVHISITEKNCMWSISIFVGYLLKYDRIAKGRTSHKKDNGKHKLFLNDLEPISKYLGIF